MSEKDELVKIFMEKVKGQKPRSLREVEAHDGAGGHALERLFGIKANGENSPDILGFELKSQTRSKTTFGDWSASWYRFTERKKACSKSPHVCDHARPDFKTAGCSREDFLLAVGEPNPEKDNRLSWSGRPFPKINQVNRHGQTLFVDAKDNVAITYSYYKDFRPNKDELVPSKFRVNDLVIAFWCHEKLRQHVENKFNVNGWFKIVTGDSGTYEAIVFGLPMDFDEWISYVKAGDIYLDSGMYSGNTRPYSSWRANNTFWDAKIVERVQ
jgi:hypothetical protein